MKCIVTVVIVDEMYNILKSLLAIDICPNMKWKWMIKVFTGAYSSMSMCLLHSCFTKGAGRISLSQVFVNFFSWILDYLCNIHLSIQHKAKKYCILSIRCM